MSGDVTVLNESLYGTMKLKVQARTTSTHVATIKPGEPVEKGASGVVAASGNFAVLALGGSPAEATNLLLGICKEESSETSTVNGHGVFYLVGLGTRIRAKATTPGNVDTIAKFDALVLDNVAFDGISAATGNTTTTPYTIDEDEGDDPNVHGLQMLVCDIETGLIEARVVGGTCMIGSGI